MHLDKDLPILLKPLELSIILLAVRLCLDLLLYRLVNSRLEISKLLSAERTLCYLVLELAYALNTEHMLAWEPAWLHNLLKTYSTLCRHIQVLRLSLYRP